MPEPTAAVRALDQSDEGDWRAHLVAVIEAAREDIAAHFWLPGLTTRALAEKHADAILAVLRRRIEGMR